MPGIVPDSINGGLQVRDVDGNTIPQPLVENGYNPPHDFNLTCTLNYLPSDCTARISAAQVNAFQAEMLCLAVSFTPEGTWNCDSTCNLSSAFENWVGNTLPNLIESTVCGEATPVVGVQPDFRVIGCDDDGGLIGMTISSSAWRAAVGTAICGSPSATSVIATTRVFVCDGAGNLQSAEIGSNVFRDMLGLSACTALPAESVDENFALVGCDGDGGLVRFNPNSLGMRQFLGLALCPVPTGGIGADTRILACDGAGGLVRVNPADFASGAIDAGTCETPVTLTGADGASTAKRYPFASVRARANRVGNGTGGLWVWTPGLISHSGNTSTLINPSPCYPMKAIIFCELSMAMDMSGDGAFSWNYYLVVNGVTDAPGAIAGQFQRAGETGTRYNTDYSTTRFREATIPPGGSLSVGHFLEMNVNSPFAAGGNRFSFNLELLGIATD